MSIFGTDKMNIRKKSDVKKDETVVPSNEDVNVDEVMRKYDRESNTRIWQGVPKAVITSVMVLFSVYCLLMTLFSVEQAETRLARFLAFVIVIGYLMYPVKKTGHSPNHIPWLDELKKSGMWFVCADMGGDTMYNLNLKGSIGLVIGNEGSGVSRLVKEKCDYIASIPMKGDIDSLNASVAAGVLAYEIERQRMM